MAHLITVVCLFSLGLCHLGSSTQYDYPTDVVSCKRYNRTSVDCTYRFVATVPFIPHSGTVKMLDLSINLISALDTDAFREFVHLQILDLSSNSISHLSDGALIGLVFLQSLDLSSNKLAILKRNVSTFRGLNQLRSLDLSDNEISDLPVGVFDGLHNLHFLDLTGNRITDITSSCFQNLESLQELRLQDNYISHLTNASFSGLDNLKLIDLMENECIMQASDLPFIKLASLQHLRISIGSDIVSTGLFTGLKRLQRLEMDMTYGYESFNWTDSDFCSLVSLRDLVLYPGYFNITDECVQDMHVTSLHYLQFGPPPYKLLNHLTDLHLEVWRNEYDEINFDTVVQSIGNLNSSLVKLTLGLQGMNINIRLNEGTLTPWAKWNSSLNELQMDIVGTNADISSIFQIKGSAFAWFPKLRILKLTSRLTDAKIIGLFSNDAFDGLKSLEELQLNGFNFDFLATDALKIFSAYHSLQRLGLAENNIRGQLNLSQFCSLSTLSYLDLAKNYLMGTDMTDKHDKGTCILQNMHTFSVGDQLTTFTSSCSSLKSLCLRAPNVVTLNAQGFGVYLYKPDNALCHQLVSIDLSQALLDFDIISFIEAPRLLSLVIADVKFSVQSILKILHMFKAPQLTTLDMGSNGIEIITKEDALFMSNLTYLNLEDNFLTSVENLQYLTNIQELILSGNKISVIPEVFLRRSNHAFLNLLDISNNPYFCSCAVEPFRRWILRDEEVDLVGLDATDGVYQCLSPEAMRGISVTEVDLDCRSPIWLYLSIGLPIFLLIISISILAIRYRWHIQYRLFLLLHRRRNHHNYFDNNYDDDDEVIDDDENGIPRFDAYIAYHVDDEDWIDGRLLPSIEEGDERFRLCLRFRDVPAGRLLINAVSLCIQRSRKTLIVLSPQYINDNFCYFQLSMAHQRLLEEGRNVLILIILEDIPDDSMTLIIRQLLRKALCLKWPNDGYGQNLFWRRLKEELKRPVFIDRRFNV